MGLHQTEKFFAQRRKSSYKMKRQPTEWENIFANDTSDKGLIFKVYKELKQLNTKKQIIQLKMDKGSE